MVRRQQMRCAAAHGAMVAVFILFSFVVETSFGSPSTAGNPLASPADLTSATMPQGPAGTQLAWFLSSVADVPLSQQEIDTHFDALFLDKISAAKINEVLAEFPAPSGAQVVEVLTTEPTDLVVIANFGTERLRVTLSVDGSGLIDGLELAPSASATSWTQIDQALSASAPDVSFLAARVANGSCQAIHQVAASSRRPLASEFKLFVLGALAHQIATGHVTWNQKLTVESQLKSSGNAVGSGSLQFVPTGTRVSVRETATKMISISDNTAADMLIDLVGQPALESEVRKWSNDPSLDVPFLTTRQALLLHYVNFPKLANEYLARAPSKRPAFLNSAVDPLALSEAQSSSEPRDVDSIEWFGSPEDVSHTFAGLQVVSRQPKLSPIASIFSVNNGGLGLNPSQWPTVWFKGGSEPGVMTVGYMATNSRGQTYLVSAMLSNPTAALAPSATFALLEAVVGAFRLMG